MERGGDDEKGLRTDWIGSSRIWPGLAARLGSYAWLLGSLLVMRLVAWLAAGRTLGGWAGSSAVGSCRKMGWSEEKRGGKGRRKRKEKEERKKRKEIWGKEREKGKISRGKEGFQILKPEFIAFSIFQKEISLLCVLSQNFDF